MAYVVTSDVLEHRFQTQQVLFEPINNGKTKQSSDLDEYQETFLNNNDVEPGFSIRQGRYNDGRLLFELDRSKKYQSILGFGGAFTDAAGRNIAKLEYEAQVCSINSISIVRVDN